MPPIAVMFATGQIVSTPGAIAACSPEYMLACLKRHIHGDWGTVCKEDAKLNDKAVTEGSRILSAYPINPKLPCDGSVWIITEADRSVTTFLLPSEY